MKAELPVYLINLDRSPDRLAAASAQLDRIGLEWTRISAVDGSLLSDQELARLAPPALAEAQWIQPLSRGEVGCYLSHVECWKHLLATHARAAVILEDDFIASEDLPAVIDSLMNCSVPWEMVKLYGKKRGMAQFADLNPGYRLVSYSRVPAYTVAQILTRQAAKRLLERFPPFGRPIDMDLKWWWEADLKLLSVDPPPVRAPESPAESLIAADRIRRPTTAAAWLRRARYRGSLGAANFRANVNRFGLWNAVRLETGQRISAI